MPLDIPSELTKHLISAIITIALFFLVKFFWDNRNYFIYTSRFKGPPALPLIGNAIISLLDKNKDVLEIATDWGKKYGFPYRVWVGPIAVIMVANPDDVQVFLTHPTSIHKSILLTKLTHHFLGDGLLISHPNKWKPRRKQIEGTFTHQILQSFMPIFTKESNILVKCLAKHVDKGEFNIQPFFNKASLDIICGTAMGVETFTQTTESAYLIAATLRGLKITGVRLKTFWMLSDIIFYMSPMGRDYSKCLKTAKDFANQVISARKLARAAQNSRRFSMTDSLTEKRPQARKAFLDYFIDIGQTDQSFPEKDLKDEVNTLILAAFETTGTTNSFVLLMIAIHPDVQEKVYEELFEIFGDSDHDCTEEDVKKLPYLEMVIKETLRLYPPVPLLPRQANVDVKLPSGMIPAGASVGLYLLDMHRNGKYWKDPEVFDPLRFTQEEIRKRHPYCYIPFAAGARNCVGIRYAFLSMKIQLSTLLRSYRVSSSMKQADIRLEFTMTMRSATGYPIKLHRRQPTVQD